MSIAAVGLLLLGWMGVAMGADLVHHDNGTEWADTTDDWGRPWGDAASSFYRRLETHRGHLAAQGIDPDKMEFAVGTEISLRKVFRPKIWFKGDLTGTATLEAARGEAEAFQLVICPLADAERTIGFLSDEKSQGQGSLAMKTVHIDGIVVSPLKHATSEFEIPADCITLYRVEYIRTIPAQYPVMHVGDWPDPLVPLAPFDIANPFCQPVWVEVRVPRDAPAGAYAGSVTVKGPHEARVDVGLTVWDFELPETPEHISMGWALHEWFRKDGLDSFLEKLDVLLDHRMAPWYAADKYKDTLPDLDRVVEWLWARGVRLQALSGKPPPALYEHLKGKGWLDRFICIWGDEPHHREYPEYRRRTEEIHRDCPGLAVAMTEDPRPDNVGLFDLWIPEPSAQNDSWVQEALRRGDRVWWYFCQLPIHAEYPGPIHANPGMVVDRPAIDHRIIYWLAFQQNIEGVAYWAISSWPDGWDAWPAESWPVNALSKFPYSGQHNGNGFICYPGPDRLPWPSIRLKCIRDGLQDYDYLSILRERGGPAPSPEIRRLLDIPPEVAMGLRYYSKDPGALLQARRQLAEHIVRLESP